MSKLVGAGVVGLAFLAALLLGHLAISQVDTVRTHARNTRIVDVLRVRVDGLIFSRVAADAAARTEAGARRISLRYDILLARLPLLERLAEIEALGPEGAVAAERIVAEMTAIRDVVRGEKVYDGFDLRVIRGAAARADALFGILEADAIAVFEARQAGVADAAERLVKLLIAVAGAAAGVAALLALRKAEAARALARRNRELDESGRRNAHAALHDPLTELGNRRRLERALAEQAAAGRRTIALLHIDLDRFKAINDTFGHAAGDAVLRVVAQRLRALAEPGDLIVRLGGDEFVMARFDRCDETPALALAERIVAALSARIPTDEGFVSAGASVGVAVGSIEADGVAETMRRADRALYRAKRAGGGRAVLAPQLEATLVSAAAA